MAEPCSKYAISSSRVVTPTGEISATIVIAGDLIQEVTQVARLPGDVVVTDFGNLVISPGLIDAHVHVNEPGTDWEGFESATKAAAAGGVTTLIDMPLNCIPVTTTVDALNQKREAARGKCHVDIGFYGGVIPKNLNALQSLLDEGLFGFKAFLCESGLDEFPASNETELRAALEILKPTGQPLLAHAELLVDSVAHKISDPTSYRQYARSRPPEFELAAIKLLIDLSREYDVPVHIVHLSTAKALPMIESAKQEGLPLTVETCPHYLFFSEEQIADGDTRFKCAPPIRDEVNRLALCNAVRTGLIDTIGSDHSPCPPELKHLGTGDFSNAWGGITGLQLMLPAIWTVGLDRGWTPEILSRFTSGRPSEVFGLSTNKGCIQPGFDADLVVWDPHAEFMVNAKDLFHRHKVSPYDKQTLQGTVSRTYVRGQMVYDAHTSPTHGAAVGKTLNRTVFFSSSISKYLNSMNAEVRRKTLETCCAAKRWVADMDASDFKHDADVLKQATDSWHECTESDWLEAFEAHPRIGNVDTLRLKFANTKATAAGEQLGVESASETTLQRLAEANDEYFEKFGFIFIVFATGKSADEMLELLEHRLRNDRATELHNASEEQLKITHLRLRKLVS